MISRLTLLCSLGIAGLSSATLFAAQAAATLPPTSQPALTPARANHLGGPAFHDVFLTDTQNPALQLAWNAVLWGTEQVLVNGRPLVRFRDYLIDYPSGRVHLQRLPAAGSVLEVAYVIQDGLATPQHAPRASANPADPKLPALDVSLRPSQPGTLHQALTRQFSSEVNSRPDTADNEPDIKFGSARPAGSSTPAPQTLASGQSLREQLATGLRLTQIDDQVSEDRGRARFSYFRADALDPQTFSDEREEFNSQLDVRPDESSRLQISNYYARESLFSDSYQEIERRRIQYEQTWGKSTAALMWERRRTDGYGLANALDALSLSLTHPVTSSLAAEGLFSHHDSLLTGRDTEGLLSLRQQLGSVGQATGNLLYRNSELNGESIESGLTLFARPTGASDVTVGLRHSDSEYYGQYRYLFGQFNAVVNPRLQFTGEASQRGMDRWGNVFTYGLGVTAQPVTRTMLEAAFSESTGQAVGTERSHSVRFTADPSSALQLRLGYDQLEGDSRGRSENSLWMLTLGGKRYLRLEGYRGMFDTPDEAFSDSVYRAEVRPLEALSLSGSLREVESELEDRSLAGVGAELHLLPGISLSANHRQPLDTEDADAPDAFGRDFRVTLTPFQGLRLFGQYSLRPENEQGVLLDEAHRSLGVETRIGSFTLEGAFTSFRGLASQEPGQQLDLLASLNVSRSTRLYGGFRTLNGAFSNPSASRLYRLGISQTAGKNMFLMLEGQFGLLVDSMGNRTWNPDDARAQARLGVRF